MKKCCFCNIECEKKQDLYFCDICNVFWDENDNLIKKKEPINIHFHNVKEIKNTLIHSNGPIKFEC